MRQNPKASATSASILPARGTSGDAPLAACCPDLEQWPASWMYEARDLLPSQQVSAAFSEFESVGEDPAQASRQPVAARRRDHLGPAREPSVANATDGASRVRRPECRRWT